MCADVCDIFISGMQHGVVDLGMYEQTITPAIFSSSMFVAVTS